MPPMCRSCAMRSSNTGKPMMISKMLRFILPAALFAVSLHAQEAPAPAGASAPRAATGGPHQVSVNDGSEAWTYCPISYDPSGNVAAIGGSNGAQTFIYDINGQLVDATVTGPGTPSSVYSHQTYGYDAYGNMLSKTTD